MTGIKTIFSSVGGEGRSSGTLSISVSKILIIFFIVKKLVPPKRNFHFLLSVLAFIRFLVPRDVKGELREGCFFPIFFFYFVS